MASVFQRTGRWYLRVKDEGGVWRKIPSSARTKTEARRFAEDFERRSERQRLGLDPLPPKDGGGTLAELLTWWLDTYSAGSCSHRNTLSAVRCHLLASELANLSLVQVTAERVEVLLHRKGQQGLSPKYVNHLRGYLSQAFNAAKKTGRNIGLNPIPAVAKRRVPRRLPDFLRAEEVPAVLQELSTRWQPLFATAVYAGLRKGELAGLRKADVDLSARLLTVARSYSRNTTKGGHADCVPIAAELVPYLQRASAASPSELVFPNPDGSMMREDVDLVAVLRRAMGRAGVVTGYQHVCRRKGCHYFEKAPDAALRRCPMDGRKLWPKPQVRPIRFHATRHSTASLLMMAGANPAAVQRIMRHSDPKLTTEVYGHLAPEYLRAEVDRLTFGVRSATQAELPECEGQGANLAPFVPPLSPQRDREHEGGESEEPKSAVSQTKPQWALQDSNLGPIGYEPTALPLS